MPMLLESTKLTHMILTISFSGTGRSKSKLEKIFFKLTGEQMEIASHSKDMAPKMCIR